MAQSLPNPEASEELWKDTGSGAVLMMTRDNYFSGGKFYIFPLANDRIHTNVTPNFQSSNLISNFILYESELISKDLVQLFTLKKHFHNFFFKKRIQQSII